VVVAENLGNKGLDKIFNLGHPESQAREYGESKGKRRSVKN